MDAFWVCLWRILVQSTGLQLPARCMMDCQHSTAQRSWALAQSWFEGPTEVVSAASLCHICPGVSATCCFPWYRYTFRSIQTKCFPSIFSFLNISGAARNEAQKLLQGGGCTMLYLFLQPWSNLRFLISKLFFPQLSL